MLQWVGVSKYNNEEANYVTRARLRSITNYISNIVFQTDSHNP